MRNIRYVENLLPILAASRANWSHRTLFGRYNSISDYLIRSFMPMALIWRFSSTLNFVYIERFAGISFDDILARFYFWIKAFVETLIFSFLRIRFIHRCNADTHSLTNVKLCKFLGNFDFSAKWRFAHKTYFFEDIIELNHHYQILRGWKNCEAEIFFCKTWIDKFFKCLVMHTIVWHVKVKHIENPYTYQCWIS